MGNDKKDIKKLANKYVSKKPLPAVEAIPVDATAVKQEPRKRKQIGNYKKVDSQFADAFRDILPVPDNVAQMLAKVVRGDARMSNKSLDDEQKVILWDVIQNAKKRTGKADGGTEYEDYGGSQYGTSTQFNDWFNRGQYNVFEGAYNSLTNPGFKLASTIGRGKYFTDPENPNKVYYTDVYDWNAHEKNFPGSNIYQKVRNTLRSGEDPNLTADKNEKYRMNFELDAKEIEKLRNKKKNGGWLEKYNDGGPVQENYNDASTSFPPNFVGAGYDTTGRNYSPAWGGQFEDGGILDLFKGKFAKFKETLPPNLRDTPNRDYDMRYLWKHSGKPKDLAEYQGWAPGTTWQQQLPIDTEAIKAGTYVPSQGFGLVEDVDDKTGEVSYNYHGNTVEPTTGRFLKPKHHSTLHMELDNWYNGTDPDMVEFRKTHELKDLGKYYQYVPKKGMQNGGDLSFISDPKLRNMLEGYKPGFMNTVGDYRLPEGRMAGSINPSSEVSTSIGGEGGEPAYLIPTFKYGQPLQDPIQEFNMTGQHLGGPFKTWQDAEKFQELRHQYVEKGQPLPSPIATSNMAMGGSLPGAVGFTYARTNDPAPSNGPYAKKTKASAQNGTEMKFYQEGLDWTPKSISKNGSKVIKDDRGQWAHPGKITEIGSNQITMQGVPYPVLGISDTGDTQMMYPNQDYTYRGSSVTEYPMMQDGGLLSFMTEPIGKAVDFVQDLFTEEKPKTINPYRDKQNVAPHKPDMYDAFRSTGELGNKEWTKFSKDFEAGNVDTYKDDKNRIKLNTGRFTGANVPASMIDDLAASARRNNIPIGQMLTLVGRESTFGQQKSNMRSGAKNEYTSGWNVAEEYRPYDPDRFLADQKVPGIKTVKTSSGWGYDVVDEKAARAYVNAHPELLDQYKAKLAKTPKIGNQNSFDLAARYLKKKGIQGYNPGDPTYVGMFQKDYNTLKTDKNLMAYLKKKGYRYEDGGELTKLDQLTNFTNYNTKQPGGWLDKYQD